jgi:hypothetical protein
MLSVVVKQGDLFPDVETTVRDENGAVVDLTAATVTFSMRRAREPGSVKINGAAGVLVDGPNGKIAYRWAGSNTDTPGTYEGEFRVTPTGGADPFHVPTDGYIEIVIEEKIGT